MGPSLLPLLMEEGKLSNGQVTQALVSNHLVLPHMLRSYIAPQVLAPKPCWEWLFFCQFRSHSCLHSRREL